MPTTEALAPHFPELEIGELVGRGGVGVVDRAKQTALGRDVALKILAVPERAPAGFAERFSVEARALASLDHPSIVTVHDFGGRGGFVFLTMELVEGENLGQAMRSGAITAGWALSRRSAWRCSSPTSTASSTATSSRRTSRPATRGTGTLSGVTWVSASLVLVVLSSLVVWNLRTLLEQRFGFRRASPFLLTLIILTVVWFLGGVVSFLGPISEGFTVLLTLGISVPWGLGHIAVGVLLLRWHGVFEASTRGIVGRTDERNRPARPARCRRGKNRGHRREPRPASIAWWIDRIVGMNGGVSGLVADTASTRMGSLDSEPIRMLSCSGVVVARASGSLLLGIRRGRRRIGRRS